MCAMLDMPTVTQVIPPGHLDQHATILALTPSLLALGTAMSVRLLSGQTGARAIAWIGLLVALAVQVAFLAPSGAAGMYNETLFHNLIRIGWAPALSATILGAWAFWRWRPSAQTGFAMWPGRVALSFLLATTLVPGFLLACEPDEGGVDLRWRTLRIATVVLATASMPWLGPAIATAIAFAAAAITSRGPWRPAFALCAVTAILPPYPL
jgi:hypothetical protein